MRSSQELLKLKGITKFFGPVKALDNVDFVVYTNECVGLVGDNGAGKSTLVKIISGAVQPDAGEVFWCGEKILLTSPNKARALGIETVYQDLALCDSLTVAQNLFLGRECVSRFLFLPLLKRQLLKERASAVLSDLKITQVDVNKKVRDLSGGQRQAVALGRAFVTSPKLLILDEPTAALAVGQTMRVLEVIRELKNHGVSIILISHRLQDILEVCDRVYVLYEGRVVGEHIRDEVTIELLAKLIARPKEKVDHEIVQD